MRIPFTKMDGLSNRSQFYTDVVTNMEQEIHGRLLARSLSRGVVTGLMVTDGSAPSVTGVNISNGLAYNDQGLRTHLSGDIFLQLSHLDINKYVTIWPTEVTGLAEAHPLTGVDEYTVIFNSTMASAVANPNSASGHIKLALIEDVQPGATPSIDIRAIDSVDRDILLGSPLFPYVTIGPVGSDADFTGSDETPFIDALDALTFTSGGVIYVKKGYYDINTGVGLTVSGYDTIHIIGEGKSTIWKFPGGVNQDIRFWNNEEVIIENLSIFGVGAASTNGFFDFRDTDIVRFIGNYCSGGIDNTTVMSLGSGIDTVWIEDNLYTKDEIVPFRVYVNHAVGSVGNVNFVGNLCSSKVHLQFGEQINSLDISENFFYTAGVNEDRGSIPRTVNGFGPEITPPKFFSFVNNIWIGGNTTGPVASPPRVSVEGAVIAANQVWIHPFTTEAIGIKDNKSAGGKDGRYSSISSNVIFHRRDGSTSAIDVADTNSSGVVIEGNVLVADGSHAGQKAILATGQQSIVDSNICDNFGTANSGGTGTWIGTTNNTSNKEL